jgi:hypothetical protein
MELSFHITTERIRQAPLRAKIAAQAMQKRREPDLRGVRDLLATFLVDEENKYLPKEDARDLIEELDDDQLNEAGKQLAAALAEHNVPKLKDKRS